MVDPFSPDVFEADGTASFQGIEPTHRLRVFNERQIDDIPQIQTLSPDQRFAMRVMAQVLPFRVNQYVLKELINWEQVPNDPIFQMTFPQPGMLPKEQFAAIADTPQLFPVEQAEA